MTDPISRYFARYPSFRFFPKADWRQIEAFNSLATQMKWSQDYRKGEFIELKLVWIELVEEEFGGNTIRSYQALCQEFGVNPLPDSIRGCKEELSRIHVNIVDLMQARWNVRHGLPAGNVPRFATSEEAKAYAEEQKKFYPVEGAQGEALRFLLR